MFNYTNNMFQYVKYNLVHLFSDLFGRNFNNL